MSPGVKSPATLPGFALLLLCGVSSMLLQSFFALAATMEQYPKPFLP